MTSAISDFTDGIPWDWGRLILAAKQQISWVIAPWWIFIPFLWPSGSLLLPSFQLFEMSLPIMFSSSIPLSFTHSSMKFQSVAAELMHDMIHADFWQPLQLFLFDIIERTSSREKHVPSDTDHCTCKVHIFWEGHKILRSLHQLFYWQT